jgi:hypothetical protein
MSDIRHPVAPKEYAGKWIAWDHAMKRIVASADSLVEVLEAAKEGREIDPVLNRVPLGILGPRRLRTGHPRNRS